MHWVSNSPNTTSEMSKYSCKKGGYARRSSFYMTDCSIASWVHFSLSGCQQQASPAVLGDRPGGGDCHASHVATGANRQHDCTWTLQPILIGVKFSVKIHSVATHIYIKIVISTNHLLSEFPVSEQSFASQASSQECWNSFTHLHHKCQTTCLWYGWVNVRLGGEDDCYNVIWGF